MREMLRPVRLPLTSRTGDVIVPQLLTAVLVLGLLWVSAQFLKRSAAHPSVPSLLFPRTCPRCRRGRFEAMGDVPHSRPAAVFARCQGCGAWFKVWYPGQWEEVTGAEVDDASREESEPEPEPLPGPRLKAPLAPRNRPPRFTLRAMMIAVAVVAVDSLIFARIARAAGRPLGPAEALLAIGAILAYNALFGLYARTVRRLSSAPYVPLSKIISILAIIYSIVIFTGIVLFIIVFT
jgi:hypothetical protein